MTTDLTIVAGDEIWDALGAAASGVLGARRDSDGTVCVLGPDIALGPEEYVLRKEDGVTVVRAGSAAGAFRALTRIRRGDHPADVYRDAPAHPWRGLMLDVARWFVPVEELIVLIDQLAARRLNVLHLHLTDDQGWRIPIPGWSRLTEIGAWRDGTTTRGAPIEGAPDPRADDDWGHGHRHDGVRHGGHYTRADLERVVAYAAERFVTVVPEIDLPGHMQAAIAAYPQLGVGAPDLPVATRFGLGPNLLAPTTEVERFIGDVLDEVCDIFPGTHVHVGGDEPRLETWRQDPVSIARAAELGLPDTDALRRWFVDIAASRLRGRGRTALYWYDGEVLSEEAIAVSWLADDGGVAAARRGAQVITADHTRTYLNYFARDDDTNPFACGIVLDEARAARFRAVPEMTDDELAGAFLGGQAQLWTEYAPHREARESLLFPRLDLIAEALWNGGSHP
ncbi:beta-N-acetylhexosaminidase [Microbacterium sp. NPDC058342]|uniref:beta-N-acetylhexosaminidase n=1 Tax=Microbacterium sp. NPDC058342 TaxID=3346454 RepID=UPI0036694236